MIRRSTIVGVVVLLAAVLYFAAAREFLTFESLVKNGAALRGLVAENYLLAATLYLAAYILTIVVLLPGALWFATVGGLMFALIAGAVYASIAVAIGTTIVFLLARYVFDHWIHIRAGHAVKVMREGVRKNPFNYLLLVRLMPLFPFTVANIAPAALDISLRTYIMATFLGTLPWTIMHVLVGVGLGDALRKGETISPSDVLLRPKVLAGLIGLTLLVLVPVVYRRLKDHHDHHVHSH